MRTQKTTPGDRYVQSLARGLAAICSFGTDTPQQTLTQVAEKTGLDRAGARRILLTLESLGYLRRNGRYFSPTPKILDLGYSYLATIPWWSLAERRMIDLASGINESVTLGVLSGPQIVLVSCVHAQNVLTVNLNVGRRSPAYCTSIGRILLGELTEEHLTRTLGEMNLVKHTKNTITSASELRKIIERDRQQGWSVVDQEYEPSVCSISVPVRNRAGQLIAAMCVVGTPLRTTAKQMIQNILPLLQDAAGNIWN
jgi:IclR family pca regulon transcriptional regulator